MSSSPSFRKPRKSRLRPGTATATNLDLSDTAKVKPQFRAVARGKCTETKEVTLRPPAKDPSFAAGRLIDRQRQAASLRIRNEVKTDGIGAIKPKPRRPPPRRAPNCLDSSMRRIFEAGRSEAVDVCQASFLHTFRERGLTPPAASDAKLAQLLSSSPSERDSSVRSDIQSPEEAIRINPHGKEGKSLELTRHVEGERNPADGFVETPLPSHHPFILRSARVDEGPLPSAKKPPRHSIDSPLLLPPHQRHGCTRVTPAGCKSLSKPLKEHVQPTEESTRLRDPSESNYRPVQTPSVPSVKAEPQPGRWHTPSGCRPVPTWTATSPSAMSRYCAPPAPLRRAAYWRACGMLSAIVSHNVPLVESMIAELGPDSVNASLPIPAKLRTLFCPAFDPETYPVVVATKLSSPAVVAKLLELGAMANALDSNGRNALHHAFLPCPTPQCDSRKVLTAMTIAEDQELMQELSFCEKNRGKSNFPRVSYSRCSICTPRLVARGTHAKLQDCAQLTNDATLLPTMVQTLCAYGVSLELRDINGQTPVRYAASWLSHTASISFLSEAPDYENRLNVASIRAAALLLMGLEDNLKAAMLVPLAVSCTAQKAQRKDHTVDFHHKACEEVGVSKARKRPTRRWLQGVFWQTLGPGVGQFSVIDLKLLISKLAENEGNLALRTIWEFLGAKFGHNTFWLCPLPQTGSPEHSPL